TQPAITAIHAPRSALEVMAHRAASRVPALSARSPACAGARSVRRGAGTAVATPDGMPARATDTATLTFGLVAIPAKIYATGALADAELVAIASYAARGKQYIVELAPYQTGLAMHQLHYADEIKPWSEIPAPPRGKPAAAELALARKVIDNLRRDRFDPSRYK